MPLRREIGEFQKHCQAIIDLINHNPELLTDFERLDIESSLMQVMNAIVRTEASRLPPRGKSDQPTKSN
jgi:hypothetical protein